MGNDIGKGVFFGCNSVTKDFLRANASIGNDIYSRVNNFEAMIIAKVEVFLKMIISVFQQH